LLEHTFDVISLLLTQGKLRLMKCLSWRKTNCKILVEKDHKYCSGNIINSILSTNDS